jgi:hypothetical protein
MRGNKGPLEGNYPQKWAPLSVRSENGPVFMAEIVQGLAKILKIKWKLHTAHRPQSSGKVKCKNWTLKTTLAKLPRSKIPLDRHATAGPTQETLYIWAHQLITL